MSCATSPGREVPLWVTDKEAAYPDREWFCFVESAADRNAAGAAAMNALAQTFRVDIRSVSDASQSMVSRIRQNNKTTVSDSAAYRQFSQNLTLFSGVSGLIGVERDIWTAQDGTVYANARMNRAECSLRYEKTIRENEALIALLKEKGEEAAGTFEALSNLNFAVTVAELTDNFYAILSVLRRKTTGERAEYGSAGELRLLKQEFSHLVVVEVQVEGDIDSRVGKAFSTVFSERGYRTSDEGTEATYILRADFSLEDLGANGGYLWVQFTLNGALTDRNGAEVLSFSETGREGHLSQKEARQRAAFRVERFIGESGFAARFDAYLDSLL